MRARRVIVLAPVLLGACGTVLGIGPLEWAGEEADAEVTADAAPVPDDASSTPDVPDIPGLMGYWPLDETAGTVARDVTGNGHDGRLGGSATFGPGRVGNGVLLGGTNAVLEMPSLAGNRFPRVGTLSFWLRGNFGAPDDAFVFDRPAERRHFVLRKRNGAILSLAFFEADGGVLANVTAAAASDVWHHVAVVWGPDEILYLDGNVRGTRDLGSWTPAGQVFVFGRTTDPFQGTIDEVRLFNRALSKAEIEALR